MEWIYLMNNINWHIDDVCTYGEHCTAHKSNILMVHQRTLWKRSDGDSHIRFHVWICTLEQLCQWRESFCRGSSNGCLVCVAVHVCFEREICTIVFFFKIGISIWFIAHSQRRDPRNLINFDLFKMISERLWLFDSIPFHFFIFFFCRSLSATFVFCCKIVLK